MLNISHFEFNVLTLPPRRMGVALSTFFAQMLAVWVFHLPVVISLGLLLTLMLVLEPAFISRPMRYLWLGAVVLFSIFFLSFLSVTAIAYANILWLSYSDHGSLF